MKPLSHNHICPNGTFLTEDQGVTGILIADILEIFDTLIVNEQTINLSGYQMGENNISILYTNSV